MWNHSWKKEEENDVPDGQECRSVANCFFSSYILFPFISQFNDSSFSFPEFDRHELQIYEEVAKVPPFQRKTLVLIGAQGVGRRSLKNRLMVLYPTRFGTTIPCTSCLVPGVSKLFHVPTQKKKRLTDSTICLVQTRHGGPATTSSMATPTTSPPGRRWRCT